MALIKKSRKWGTHPTQITKYDIQKNIKEREDKETNLDILDGKPLGKQEEDTNDAE
jgi:hypothetical protein|tara:strand:+ start:2232 stop:2399 length:168 start_codon:yes stop_codon:yes gene_type:complete